MRPTRIRDLKMGLFNFFKKTQPCNNGAEEQAKMGKEEEKSSSKSENIITDQKQLLKIAEKSTEEEKLAYQILVAINNHQGNPNFAILHEAVASLTNQNLIADIAKNNKYAGIRSAALKKLTLQKVLIDIAKNDNNIDVRRNAIGFVTDQSVLANIAKNDKQSGAREATIYHLEDQEVLAYIALNDDDNRYAAISRITDQNILTKLTKNNNDKVREWALEILNRNNPDDNNKVEVRLNDGSVLSDNFGFGERYVTNEDQVELFNFIGSSSNEMNERIKAVQKMTDNELLYKIASHYIEHYDSEELGQAALRRITNMDLLLEFALTSYAGAGIELIIELIDDEAVLQKIADDGATIDVREYAEEKLVKLKRKK